jgi:hypothetical protein
VDEERRRNERNTAIKNLHQCTLKEWEAERDRAKERRAPRWTKPKRQPLIKAQPKPPLVRKPPAAVNRDPDQSMSDGEEDETSGGEEEEDGL